MLLTDSEMLTIVLITGLCWSFQDTVYAHFQILCMTLPPFLPTPLSQKAIWQASSCFLYAAASATDNCFSFSGFVEFKSRFIGRQVSGKTRTCARTGTPKEGGGGQEACRGHMQDKRGSG